jgi:hypothetical protein
MQAEGQSPRTGSHAVPMGVPFHRWVPQRSSWITSSARHHSPARAFKRNGQESRLRENHVVLRIGVGFPPVNTVMAGLPIWPVLSSRGWAPSDGMGPWECAPEGRWLLPGTAPRLLPTPPRFRARPAEHPGVLFPRPLPGPHPCDKRQFAPQMAPAHSQPILDGPSPRTQNQLSSAGSEFGMLTTAGEYRSPGL